MRAIFILFCCFLFCSGHAQTEKEYKYNLLLSDAKSAPQFKEGGNYLVYVGKDQAEKAFFSRYKISNVYQTYPSSRVTKTLNYFMFITKDKSLADDLVKNFPQKYLEIEDMTNVTYVLADYYPNDYGSFSPVTNLGLNFDMRCFDYIHAPKAWDYSKGEVKIGISDAKVLSTDAEFSGKTTIYHPTSYVSGSHGSGVSAIAAAIQDNAYGITGVCPKCEILNTPYGSYNYL